MDKNEKKEETVKDKEEKKNKEPKKETKESKKEKKESTKGIKKESKLKKESPKIDKPKDANKEDKEIKHIIRIADTDLDGKRQVQLGLTGIKGIGRRISRIIADNAGVSPTAILGYLEEDEIERLKNSVGNIGTIAPFWMENKQNDLMIGEDKHLIGTDVMISMTDDINLAKKIRSYKGIRHERGLRVRGQRTRSTGRKGRTVGVARISLQKPKAEKKEEKKEEPVKKK